MESKCGKRRAAPAMRAMEEWGNRRSGGIKGAFCDGKGFPRPPFLEYLQFQILRRNLLSLRQSYPRSQTANALRGAMFAQHEKRRGDRTVWAQCYR
jgi:hypothetical protein